MTHLFDVLKSESQTSFVPQIVFIAALILNVVAREFIYSVVSQVHVQVVKIVLVGRSVFARCESAQAFLVEEDA